MTKTEIVAAVAASVAMPKAQVSKVVDAMVEAISKTLVRGEKVQLSGLGTFGVKRREARDGRNPQSGKKMVIPAHNAVGFKPAKPLKEAVK